MTLNKAILLLTFCNTIVNQLITWESSQALQMAIEALKREKRFREDPTYIITPLIEEEHIE